MTDLFIVESPSKIKKILGYLKSLGVNAKVLASFGHIRDLDRKTLSIDVNDNFKPTYLPVKDKAKIIRELKSESKKCLKSGGTIWLASDFDREGESIAWHLYKVLNLNKDNVKRAIFTEITKNALKNAVENPKELDLNMFYSQQARRILDRLIGYLVSPILWKHFNSSYKKKCSLSAGRVQSIVVKLVKEREDEINSFESSKYYKITGIFDNVLNAELSTTFEKSKNVEEFLNHCASAIFTVKKIKSKKTTRKPSAPFITSSLQQEASIKFGFSPKQTMRIAQKLYENGLITYMRTDSLNLSIEALDSIQKEIEERYGAEYYNRKIYSKKVKNSQEAHEAIRPSIMNKNNLHNEENMGADDNKLYKLIWKRTIASQMAPAKVNIMTIKISISDRDELFIAKGESILFEGFLRVYSVSKEDSEDSGDDSNELSLFKSYNEGQEVKHTSITAAEKRTKPPHGHYSEASLVKKLEAIGVGRPSTYSSSIAIVQDRKYVKKENKKGEQIILKIYTLTPEDDIQINKKKQFINTAKNKLFITNTGELITNFLQENFENIMNYEFTANVEAMLDNIADGDKVWHEVVKYFYDQFHPQTVKLNSLTNFEKDKHKRVLGKEPESEKDVIVYIGKYGPVACIVDPDDTKKNRYSSLNSLKIAEVTLEQALKLFRYPKLIYQHKNENVMLYKGRYGLYLKYNNKNYSLKDIPESEIDNAKIISVLEEVKSETNIIKKINEDIIIRNGRYGPYINYKKKFNVKIWGSKKPEDLTLKDCMSLIKKKQEKSKYK